MERIEEKKKIILDILAGEFYVPMKIKELAIVLNVPKKQAIINPIIVPNNEIPNVFLIP